MVFFCVFCLYSVTLSFMITCISTRSYLLLMLFVSFYIILSSFLLLSVGKRYVFKNSQPPLRFSFFPFVLIQFENLFIWYIHIQNCYSFLNECTFTFEIFDNVVFISVLSDINIVTSSFFWSIFHSISFVFMLVLQPISTNSNAFLVYTLQLVHFASSFQCSC